MALDINYVATVVFSRRPPEVIEADVVEGRGRLEGRDMPAQLRGFFIGAHHHRDRVPSNDGADTPLDLTIARIARLAVGRDRVDVRRMGIVRQVAALLARFVDEILQQEMSAIDAFRVDYSFQRVEPFGGFFRI